MKKDGTAISWDEEDHGENNWENKTCLNLAMLSLRFLLKIQVEMSERQLVI